MTIRVIRAGLQTTIQAAPRSGLRHLGVPASGAADALSLALANHLVGNSLLAPALEATLTGPTLKFGQALAFALTGGTAAATLNGSAVDFHTTVFASAGDELAIGSVEAGARVYIAFAGGLAADEMLGSASTYMSAKIGGHDGRKLAADDQLELASPAQMPGPVETPDEFRPPITNRWALRATGSAETALLADGRSNLLADTNWVIGRRADRMGIRLEGPPLDVGSEGRMPSAPVFPGTIQCPEDGAPYILGVDSGTTGGYPRIAHIARADRHLLGQLRPGDHLRLLPRQAGEAVTELGAKHDYWREWLPCVETVI
jgi:allophanate hydrolase